MEEAELLRLAAESVNNAITSFTVLLTISTAHLMASYKVGKQLNRSQVVIVNLLFTVCSIFFTLLAGFAVRRAVTFGSAAANLNTVEVEYHEFEMAALWMGAMCTFIYAACLKFLWDVRHSKTE